MTLAQNDRDFASRGAAILADLPAGSPVTHLLMGGGKDQSLYVLNRDLLGGLGDTNAVHVRLTDHGYEVTDLVHGDTVTEVLNYVQFHASDLLATFRRKVAKARELSRQEANSFIADYVAGLEGYTYLEGENP